MKVAVVHDCLVTLGGAEKVLKEILSLFPEADLFSLLDFLPDKKRPFKKSTTTFIQKLPLSKTKYRYYFPLMPHAIETLDLSAYDLIISSSYLVAKGVLISPHQCHICYCHTPMRFIWDLQSTYLKNMGLKKYLAKFIFHKMRLWDTMSSHRVDAFIANSEFVKKRIAKYYRREAKVIYPPIDVERFTPTEKKEDYYLTCSRLVAYKKTDLIVQAFAKLRDKRLIVIGDGPELKKLKQMASPNVTFLGKKEDGDVKLYMEKAKAFIHASLEDFGIAPLEAQSAGVPVIAFGQGGALETIKGLEDKNPTGCFFYEQSKEALVQAISLFENNYFRITAKACRKNAELFSTQKFRKQFLSFVETCYKDRNESDFTCRRKGREALAPF